MNTNPPKFESGNVCSTPGAAAVLPTWHMRELLIRHLTGDWGDLCQEDKDVNEVALKEGGRIMSSYTVNTTVGSETPVKDHKIWVITEADRSVTTFLLPDEY